RMGQVSDALAIPLEQSDLPAGAAAGALARELVAPEGGIPRHADLRAGGGGLGDLDQEGDVAVLGRAYAPARRRRPSRQRLDPRAGTAAPLDGELVAELSIEPRDAADRLHVLTALGAPAMDDLELRPDEAAAAARGRGADELGLSHGDRHATVGPRLPDEVQAGDDGPAARVDDHRGVGGAERGMPSLEEITGPGGE